jgi:hypothetical protein
MLPEFCSHLLVRIIRNCEICASRRSYETKHLLRYYAQIPMKFLRAFKRLTRRIPWGLGRSLLNAIDSDAHDFFRGLDRGM